VFAIDVQQPVFANGFIMVDATLAQPCYSETMLGMKAQTSAHTLRGERARWKASSKSPRRSREF
jgi:hypothetical protein